jgi:hypothetical protein
LAVSVDTSLSQSSFAQVVPWRVMNASPSSALAFGAGRFASASRRAFTVSGHGFARRSTPVFGRG